MTTQPMQVRQDLVGRLMTIHNNYILGLASLALLTSTEAEAVLRRDSASFGAFTVNFGQVADLLQKPVDREDSCKSFLIMLMCALIKDTFELTRHHCKSTGRLQLLTSQPWHQFARLVRNCMGHNFLFEFRPGDIALLPISWRHCTLTAAMNGQPLPLSLFGYAEAWSLFEEMRAFAEVNKL